MRIMLCFNKKGWVAMHSFLLIGQSNMAGRGFIGEAHELDTSHIYILRNGRWQKMFRPIHPDRRFSGVCLAESFAEAYAKKHGVDVGLICCADGGTQLSQWMPGELLFDNAVFQAKLAQRTSEIVGVLWHQGESDCPDDLYPTYQKRFEIMMNALRAQLNLDNVPFVLGGLGDFLTDSDRREKFLNYPHINDALKSIAAQNKNVGFASAEGLTANPDNLHFNADSLYKFGIRYFDEFEKLNVRTDTAVNIREDITRSELELL